MDKMAIHMLFSFMRMHYGVPYIDIQNINDLSGAPISKYLANPQTIGAKIDKNDPNALVLVKLKHNGEVVESKILKEMLSDNKLNVK
jgi:hypothetical protein